MNRIEFPGSGSSFYKGMTLERYYNTVDTPSNSLEYFEAFHKPLIERVKQRFGSPVHVFDMACGPADELKFIKDDPDVVIVATDISSKILPVAKETLTRTATSPNKSPLVFASEAEFPPFKENIAEAGIMVNAMAYDPDKMLETMYRALRPLGQCVVNFKIYSQLHSRNFKALNGKESLRKFIVSTSSGSETFDVMVRDFSGYNKPDGSPDLALRSVGEQLYFLSVEDIKRLIELIGFKKVNYTNYKPVNDTSFSATHVFVLEKPSSY